jgi:diguanylate cyclase (GGDEF)-like protein
MESAASGDENRRLVFLFVDDPEETAAHVALLEAFGYQVRVSRDPGGVSGGPLAFHPLALVVSNRHAENVGRSLEALKRLSGENRLTCPAIFISEHDNVAVRISAVRAGCSAFLGRPFNPMALVDTLDRLADERNELPFRVLLVDDSATHARYYASILETAGMTTQILTDPLRLIAELASFQPEIVLTDLYMPLCGGAELAAVIRQEEHYDSIPIVFLSSEEDAERRLAALGRGHGDDFLAKNSVPEHLIQAVKLRARRFRELRHHILHDGLTGLLKHTAAKEALARTTNAALRRGTPLTAAMLDIDHFKSVNDTYGHPAGDIVIKTLARLLKQRMRPGDAIGRIGGEEFVVILDGLGAATAKARFDALREEFGAIVHNAGPRHFSVTMSCGLADIQTYKTAMALTEAADQALYTAKTGGRNRVVVAAG